MSTTSSIRTAGILLAAILLGACGGGGGGGTSTDASFTGTITGFGSVFVNGVEFETDTASIYIDGVRATEDDLRVGMQVRVEGSADGSTGQATNIAFDDDLEGLVLSNSIPAGERIGSMNIMGHTVLLSSGTVFESKVMGVTGPDQVTAGMVAEVSGFTDGTGEIRATRVELKAADLASYLAVHPEGIEVKGIVSNHDLDNQKFDIGSMTVDYSAALVDDMPVGSFNGLYVEVKSIAGIDTNSGELLASKVEPENDGDKGYDGKDNDEAEIEGVISTAIDGNRFAVNGQPVIINEQTEFDDISQSSLLEGVMVEVEGYFLDGDLVALKVEGEDESHNELEGMIVAIDLSATNSGSVTLAGDIIIDVTSDTLMKDSRDDGYVPDQKFNLQSLSVGDYVEVYFYIENNRRIATVLERDDP